MKNLETYWLTRYILLRLLGFVYLFAFLSLFFQVVPLLGENGILPADNYLTNIKNYGYSFFKLPTIFWFHMSDNLMLSLAVFGLILSFIVLIGYANSVIMFLLWSIYLSFVNIGQLFYSYGWEIQLLEIGFLAIFFVPLFEMKPFPKSSPPLLIIWLFRLLTFKIYLGAGLIKIRGDECWRNLTCMFYHYETQPIPNPLSPYLHFMPGFFHRTETLYNHFIELIVPFFVFYPRKLRIIAGILFLTFQIFLIFSGNLSFLNWLTIIPGLVLFDDKLLKKILPRTIVNKAENAEKNKKKKSKLENFVIISVFILLLWLSIPVVNNLLSKNQYMNTSFNQWKLVNTYGAFGSIGKERHELIVLGTSDEIITNNTLWKEYEFKAKPTDIKKALPIIAPYQPRIDWQIWFAAMSIPEREPWLIHFVWKLLNNDEKTLSLISKNPFPDKPPKFIKIDYYKYEFAELKDKEVWKRTFIKNWLNPLSKETTGFKELIKANNWETYEN